MLRGGAPSLFRIRDPTFSLLVVILNLSVLRVKLQFAAKLPGDVGELKHSYHDVALKDWSVEFLSFCDSRDEVSEMGVGWDVAIEFVIKRRSSSLNSPVFSPLRL
jgi:hypothetical protein